MFDLLDGLILLAGVAFAFSGYRQGFVVGVMSFIGFLGGAVLGAKVSPWISDLIGTGQRSALTGIITVLVCAILGQIIASALGQAVRRRMTWRPARTVDSVGGALISAVSVLLVAWLIAIAVNRSAYVQLRRQVANSSIIKAVDGFIPNTTRTWFSNFLQLVEQQGFPQVFAQIGGENVAPAQPPNPALVNSPVVQSTKRSVVKINGDAPNCGRAVEGSGFVVSPQHVMTNAHVVAGVSQPVTVTDDDGNHLRGYVVKFDPEVDVAVLYVPGLTAAPLAFDTTVNAAAQPDAIVLGYPLNGSFNVQPARIRSQLRAVGQDIYSENDVDRSIFALYALVRPGNSGGPLISTSGRVYGVIFAAAQDDPNTGYALTAKQVQPDFIDGRFATKPTGTGSCDAT